MRDEINLYTVIVIPKGALRAPILLTRTPYNAATRAERVESPRMIEAVRRNSCPGSFRAFCLVMLIPGESRRVKGRCHFHLCRWGSGKYGCLRLSPGG
jgi:hypothetical protein